MEKLIYLLGETDAGTVPTGRAALRERLFSVAEGLEAVGARGITFGVADVEDPLVETVPQFNSGGLLDAHVSLWVDHVDACGELEAILAPVAPRCAGYLVTESILREYPERPRGKGRPSPGIALVATFPKPDALDDATFYARWHDSHGPLSLDLHPLTRYVRNAVFRSITKEAPPLRAIVSESVESCAVAADVEQFYSGRANRKKIITDLLSFAEFESMSSVVMREYIWED